MNTLLIKQKKEKTRHALIVTGLALFMKQGFESTTIEHITKTAGISRKTFFNYFKSKEHLLFSAANHWYQEAVLQKLPPPHGATALERLRNTLFDRIHLLSGHRPLMTLFLSHMKGVGIRQAVLPPGEEPRDDILREALRLFRKAHADGELAPGMTAEHAFQAYIAIRNMILHAWVRHPDDSPDALLQQARTMLDILFHGCAAYPVQATGPCNREDGQ